MITSFNNKKTREKIFKQGKNWNSEFFGPWMFDDKKDPRHSAYLGDSPFHDGVLMLLAAAADYDDYPPKGKPYMLYFGDDYGTTTKLEYFKTFEDSLVRLKEITGLSTVDVSDSKNITQM